MTYDDAGYFASSVECFHDDVSHAARNYDLVGVGVGVVGHCERLFCYYYYYETCPMVLKR